MRKHNASRIMRISPQYIMHNVAEDDISSHHHQQNNGFGLNDQTYFARHRIIMASKHQAASALCHRHKRSARKHHQRSPSFAHIARTMPRALLRARIFTRSLRPVWIRALFVLPRACTPLRCLIACASYLAHLCRAFYLASRTHTSTVAAHAVIVCLFLPLFTHTPLRRTLIAHFLLRTHSLIDTRADAARRSLTCALFYAHCMA